MSGSDNTAARLEALEQKFSEMSLEFEKLRALKRGEPGRDGLDGRDGRDGKSASARDIASAFVNLMPRSAPPAIHVETPVVVHGAQPEAPHVFVNLSAPENHVHLSHAPHDARQLEVVEELAGVTRELRETMQMPVKPVYDKAGKLIGGERVKSLQTSERK